MGFLYFPIKGSKHFSSKIDGNILLPVILLGLLRSKIPFSNAVGFRVGGRQRHPVHNVELVGHLLLKVPRKIVIQDRYKGLVEHPGAIHRNG